MGIELQLERHTMHRIPSFGPTDNTPEIARQWCIALCEVGLDYHLDDDPADIITIVKGKAFYTFSETEVKALRYIVQLITNIEGFCPHEVMIEWYQQYEPQVVANTLTSIN